MFKSASDSAKRNLHAFARSYGKLTGKYLTESQYNNLSEETRNLIQKFDINTLIGNAKDNIQKIKILMLTQNVIKNALDKVYPRRLEYLLEKKSTDPTNQDTQRKISEIQDLLPKLKNIQNAIESKLRELDPTGAEQQRINDNKGKPSVSGNLDPIDIMLYNSYDSMSLIDSLGDLLKILGHAAGLFATATITAAFNSGGKRLRSQKYRKRKSSGKRKTMKRKKSLSKRRK